MKVTIKDVAKEANVATSTVSRVLSNSSSISEETKKKVNEAIKKLNYVPNAMARGLANKKTNILAVIAPPGAGNIFDNQFFVQAMKGISMCAEEKNYYIMYAFEDKKYKETEWIKRFVDSNLVDGICLLRAKENDECIQYLNSIDFPFVVIGKQEKVKDMLWVDNDNFKAVYELVDLLLERGKEKIAFIGAEKNLNVSIERLRGYKEALRKNSIEVDNDLIYEGAEFSIEEGEKGAARVINKDVKAIVASDDLLAFGAQNTIKLLGREDISIVGFNNVYLSAYREPALASVDINAEKLGYYAVKLLVDYIRKGSVTKSNYIIDTKLIERESL